MRCLACQGRLGFCPTGTREPARPWLELDKPWPGPAADTEGACEPACPSSPMRVLQRRQVAGGCGRDSQSRLLSVYLPRHELPFQISLCIFKSSPPIFQRRDPPLGPWVGVHAEAPPFPAIAVHRLPKGASRAAARSGPPTPPSALRSLAEHGLGLRLRQGRGAADWAVGAGDGLGTRSGQGGVTVSECWAGGQGGVASPGRPRGRRLEGRGQDAARLGRSAPPHPRPPPRP